MEAYARSFKDMHVIVLTGKPGLVRKSFGNIHLYPAGSRSRIGRLLKARALLRIVPRVDIVTAQDPFECGLVALVATRRRGAALHIQVHTDLFSPAFKHHSFLNTIRVRIALSILRRADAVRAVSGRVKRSIEKRLRTKRPIAVLPIFVDVVRFQAVGQDPALVARFLRFRTKLLLVSRLESEKHPALAVRALAQTPSDTCLIIVGEGSEHARLAKLIHALHLADRVFLEGRHASAKYYKVADLVLVTSRYEGYGRVFIEAGAAGKPVLSTDVGIAREAGATIADQTEFGHALRSWIESGRREGRLPEYPYRSFDAYVDAYCADIIRSCGALPKSP